MSIGPEEGAVQLREDHVGPSFTYLSSIFMGPMDPMAGLLTLGDLKVYHLKNALVFNSHY